MSETEARTGQVLTAPAPAVRCARNEDTIDAVFRAT
jgi:hypothetical protein